MQVNVLRQVLGWESGSGATGHFGVSHSDWNRFNVFVEINRIMARVIMTIIFDCIQQNKDSASHLKSGNLVRSCFNS